MTIDCRGLGWMHLARVMETANDGDELLVDSESVAESGNRAAERWGQDLKFTFEKVKDPLV